MNKKDRNRWLFCSAKKDIGDYFRLVKKIDQSVSVGGYYYVGDKRYSLDVLNKARKRAILSARDCTTQRKCFQKWCIKFSNMKLNY